MVIRVSAAVFLRHLVHTLVEAEGLEYGGTHVCTKEGYGVITFSYAAMGGRGVALHQFGATSRGRALKSDAKRRPTLASLYDRRAGSQIESVVSEH